ncbi:transcriptional repressor [Flavobacteriaceae bacterium F08102]|nr:transcriptional repressor [Flavobacteriaceae bacterium F08102]
MSEIEQQLAEFNIRPTAMRMLVYQFIEQQQKAVSLSVIEDYFDKADRTTLYRTIKTFEEKAVVHQIDDGTGVAKYALCEPGCGCDIGLDLHLHFHCTHCNDTTCLTDHKIPKIKVPAGYIAENINLVVKGICDLCNRT